MKIAIMMRAIDQDSGFHLYVEGLVDAMLRKYPQHQFFLFYRTTKWYNRFKKYENAKEILLKAPHKLIWDQVVTPYHAWKNKVDVIFNPKFTVPLISHCPSVMGLQEPAWWAWPEHYEKIDVFYEKFMLPVYMRKSSHFFPMAQWVIDENRKYFNLPFDNATVTNPGVHNHLKPVENKELLEKFREEYGLPNEFILSLTRVDNPGMDSSHKWNPSKNPHTTLKAFLKIKNSIQHDLVFAGRNVKEYFLDIGFTENDLERVRFVNFVPFKRLQYLYSLADLMVVPSYYESFGFSLLGSIACGCPAVASTEGACNEVTGNAALYADPNSPDDFAEKILKILQDEDLRNNLKRKSIERAKKFTWEKTAEETLKGIYKTLGQHPI